MKPGKIGRPVAKPEASESVDSASGLSTPDFGMKYPNLHDFLARERPGSKWHKTGCLTMFWEDGVYKLCLNDRPNKKSTFVSHVELATAFQIADRGLRSGTLRWRQKGYKEPMQRELNMRIG